MKPAKLIKKILGKKQIVPQKQNAKTFAPSNVALCKYWGKRNTDLNLPVTSSLSVSLGHKGAEVEISQSETDEFILNDKTHEQDSPFSQSLKNFLALFPRKKKQTLQIKVNLNLPIAAGLASSACIFAAIVKALDQLCEWQLDNTQLSILARLGSGSACRSLWDGFVEWTAGVDPTGMDSHGTPIDLEWNDLCVGILLLNEETKPISSREAMKRTVETSDLYEGWKITANKDLLLIKEAIYDRDFAQLGHVAESNAMAMHATMLSASPPITYSVLDTLTATKKVWFLRDEGLPIYFTQDAGPNLKLLFLKQSADEVLNAFPDLDIVEPFGDAS